MDKSKYDQLFEAIHAFEASYTINTGRHNSPHSVNQGEAVSHLKAGLFKGHPIHPPSPVVINGAFTGMHLAITDPIQEGKPVVRRGGVTIHVDLNDPLHQIDANAIGYALLAIATAETFAEQTKPEAK